jgi:hypothetical protein
MGLDSGALKLGEKAAHATQLSSLSFGTLANSFMLFVIKRAYILKAFTVVR